jgi:pimeloyl-ACP methyl ester carboxylesterase
MMGTAYPMKVSDALLATALENPLRAIDMVNAWSFSTFAAKPSFPGPGMSLHGSNRALMRRMQAGAPGLNLFHQEFTTCNRYAGGAATAAHVRCPVTFVLGNSDQMTPPKAAREIAGALKASVVTVEAGHNLMAEAPDAVLSALRVALA